MDHTVPYSTIPFHRVLPEHRPDPLALPGLALPCLLVIPKGSQRGRQGLKDELAYRGRASKSRDSNQHYCTSNNPIHATV